MTALEALALQRGEPAQVIDALAPRESTGCVDSPAESSTGTPSDRKASHNLVDQMVAEFARREAFTLVIPPEGTRRRVETWKSGFYHIALGAHVPVVPGYLDYGRKRAGLGPPIELTGDPKVDMDAIRAFYATMDPKGKVPANVGPVALRDEAAPRA